MLRFALPSLLTVTMLVVASCANVNSGGGGSGGDGGSGGATAVLPQPVLDSEPAEFSAEPPMDAVDDSAEAAVGRLAGACRDGGCSGADPADQWTIQPTSSGAHRIHLTWTTSNDVDLDLFLADEAGDPLDSSATVGTLPETIDRALTAGRLYIIQVQAFDTFGQTQGYTLRVTEGE